MIYPLPKSLNSWLVIALGLIFFFGGLCHVILLHDRILSFGLVATGLGFFLLGLTEGFSDPTPRGKLLYRIAIVSFIVGVPIMIKAAYEMASSEW